MKDTSNGETCDDGNTVKWDGCSDTCKVNFLKIAIESAGSCTTTNQQVLADTAALLTARGHTVTLLDASGVDMAAEINAYDVIVLGGYTANCMSGTNDMATFDAVIPNFLAAGHGLVASGWFFYTGYSSTAPNIQAAMPTVISDAFLTAPFTMTPVGSHPIIAGAGLTPFTGGMYAPCAGGTKAGATALLSSSGDCGAAWKNGGGRTVFLGPLFADNYASYMNQSLLDGTQPSSVSLYMRSIEWAGGWYE